MFTFLEIARQSKTRQFIQRPLRVNKNLATSRVSRPVYEKYTFGVWRASMSVVHKNYQLCNNCNRPE